MTPSDSKLKLNPSASNASIKSTKSNVSNISKKSSKDYKDIEKENSLGSKAVRRKSKPVYEDKTSNNASNKNSKADLSPSIAPAGTLSTQHVLCNFVGIAFTITVACTVLCTAGIAATEESEGPWQQEEAAAGIVPLKSDDSANALANPNKENVETAAVVEDPPVI